MKPYTVEKAKIPMPRGQNRSTFTEAILEMEVGDCILTDMRQSDAISRAKAVGLKYMNKADFKSSKQPDGRFAIWRTA